MSCGGREQNVQEERDVAEPSVNQTRTHSYAHRERQKRRCMVIQLKIHEKGELQYKNYSQKNMNTHSFLPPTHSEQCGKRICFTLYLKSDLIKICSQHTKNRLQSQMYPFNSEIFETTSIVKKKPQSPTDRPKETV